MSIEYAGFSQFCPLGHEGQILLGDDPQGQHQDDVDHAAHADGADGGQGVAQVEEVGQQAVGPQAAAPIRTAAIRGLRKTFE